MKECNNSQIGKKGFCTLYKLDKERVIQLYITENKTTQEVANLLGITRRTLEYFLNKEGIKKGNTARYKNTIKTVLKKYGSKSTFSSKEVQNKSKITMHARYGVEYAQQSQNIREKSAITCYTKYNVRYTSQIPEAIEKRKQTCLRRYGYENVMQNKQIQEKGFRTKHINNTFNSSSKEKEILKLLKLKFKEVKTQYRSKEYPFNCDFYIPKLDLYIEYQGFWTHGKKPFEKTDEDLQTISLWKSKNTRQYLKAVNDWTVRDPIKRQIAKENNLNWKEFFTMEQFMNWYKEL